MSVKLVECPRDAMQGFKNHIPAEKKIEYINALLKVGFTALDCGSFVSAKAVPQLADTEQVLNAINKDKNKTRLLTIVANERGAELACEYEQIDEIGFPFSISETFQLRNTKQTIKQALSRLINIKSIADQTNKDLLVYLSMAFGNPYQDEWSAEIACDWCRELSDLGVKYINISDTIGVAQSQDIAHIFKNCISEIPSVEFGAHFHTRPDNYLQNISAAYNNGCRKFDSAIKGLGGCQFASDQLTGNLPTEALLAFLEAIGEDSQINQAEFDKAFLLAGSVFV